VLREQPGDVTCLRIRGNRGGNPGTGRDDTFAGPNGLSVLCVRSSENLGTGLTLCRQKVPLPSDDQSPSIYSTKRIAAFPCGVLVSRYTRGGGGFP
jgi:hypothetical protein